MTPKEKAKELYENMLNGFQFTIDEYTAKQCALILVNEMIDNCDNTIVNEFIRRGAISYWQEVKQEIELL